jgi:hypothetical protein
LPFAKLPLGNVQLEGFVKAPWCIKQSGKYFKFCYCTPATGKVWNGKPWSGYRRTAHGTCFAARRSALFRHSTHLQTEQAEACMPTYQPQQSLRNQRIIPR